MGKYRLVIGDKDIGYVTALADYLTIDIGNSFYVKTFSDDNLLKAHLMENTVDILLATPDFINADLPKEKLVIALIEDKIPPKVIEYPIINKYTIGNKMAKEIMNIHAKHSDEEMLEDKNNNECKIIGIYSPIGGVGKTTISLALGKFYAVAGNKTLFLSLEPTASYERVLGCNPTHNFSDLLYYLKQKNKNLLLKIEALKNVDILSGMHYLNPPLCYKDLEETSIDDWKYFLGYLAKQSSYQYIILDFTSSLSEKNIELLKECNARLLITSPNLYARTKIKAMNNQLKLLHMEDIFTKQIFNNNTNDFYELEASTDQIPHEENCLMIMTDFNNPFGMAISKIANDL